MKVARALSFALLAAGVALVGLAFSCGGGNKAEAPTPTPAGLAFNSTPGPTMAVATNTSIPPSPTPTPFDGAVARLKIPRFNVDSEIEPLGLTADNRLDVPHNPHNTGWYSIYSKPGFGKNAVFSAHVDYFPNIKGPFYNLAKMEVGDEVIVVMENGLEYRYRVIANQRFLESRFPTGELIDAPDRPEGSEWITLITCGGEFRATSPSGAGEYLHRDVIIAERIS
jgi:sortase (surface protein transpeptidase)